MPTLSGVTSTSDLADRLDLLFTTPFGVDLATPTRIVLRNAGTDTIFEFEGAGLAIERVFNFFFNFSVGTIETLTIRSALTGTILAQMTGLEIDVIAQEEIFQGADALADYVASLSWTMIGTSGTDTYDLTDIAGFRASVRNVIALDAGDDEVRGGNGIDIINVGIGNDTIIDSKGNDVAFGRNGNDVFSLGAGANGNDRFYGENGNDSLQGGTGKDKLFGGNGNDSLDGGSGIDELTGGTGRDTITGGTGADIFIFAAADGVDLINGFDLLVDTIRIEAANVTISVAQGDAVIRYGANRITLDGIDPDDLVIGDHIVLL